MVGDEDGGSGPRTVIPGDLSPCWLCRRLLSPRALFCHACGAIQPARDLDPFAQLNMERRFDIALEALDRQHTGLLRTVDPARFLGRGPREQQFAADHKAAMERAHETLRDPLRRAIWLLADAGVPVTDATDDPEVGSLRAGLAAAADVHDVDHVATNVMQHLEHGVRSLAAAFRADDLPRAAAEVARLGALEALAAAARERRRHMPIA